MAVKTLADFTLGERDVFYMYKPVGGIKSAHT